MVARVLFLASVFVVTALADSSPEASTCAESSLLQVSKSQQTVTTSSTDVVQTEASDAHEKPKSSAAQLYEEDEEPQPTPVNVEVTVTWEDMQNGAINDRLEEELLAQGVSMDDVHDEAVTIVDAHNKTHSFGEDRPGKDVFPVVFKYKATTSSKGPVSLAAASIEPISIATTILVNLIRATYESMGSNELVVINLHPSRKLFQPCYKWMGISGTCVPGPGPICSNGLAMADCRCPTSHPFPELNYGQAIKMSVDQALYFKVADGWSLCHNEPVRPMCDNDDRHLTKGGVYVFNGDCVFRDLKGFEDVLKTSSGEEVMSSSLCKAVDDKVDCMKKLKCALDGLRWTNKPGGYSKMAGIGSYSFAPTCESTLQLPTKKGKWNQAYECWGMCGHRDAGPCDYCGTEGLCCRDPGLVWWSTYYNGGCNRNGCHGKHCCVSK